MASSRSPRGVTRTPIDPRHFISMKDVEQISQTQLTYSQPGELEVVIATLRRELPGYQNSGLGIKSFPGQSPDT